MLPHDQTNIVSPESEGIAQGNVDIRATGSVGNVVQVALRIRVQQADGRR